MPELRVFVITPVRSILPEWRQALDNYVERLQRQGYLVYYPPRDTTQSDSGLEICRQNREAILGADEVHVAWDGKSKGCLFDLGMAFVFGKLVVPIVGFFPKRTPHKSFASMVYEWEERGRA